MVRRGEIGLETDVLLAQKGDKEAFTRLIEECELTLYRVSKGILKDDADCADAIQETILKCYHSITQLKQPKYFKTWLTRILINECNDMLKKRKKLVLLESVDAFGSSEKNPEEFTELKEALLKLDDKHRIVLILFYYEEFSIKEMAQILKVREGTVKSRLNRARHRLLSIINLSKNERGVENE
ncbi:RNA polymerase sigma factor [Lederbergia wuyishanensis]|uniref:RNA polymerase sigma-70 factor (ECF subfamily) n=1 Tax=Lederbergia wuyishanensis TaxID=1347903 RepID=A0ABU0D2W2_9BACI|nr:sigma-70 family RNA polymerase sigma factor [Lederbergia wuyishanensis]MCJ8007121.1 sigma-70 family RNA polymerase sigma factor [Lederbergia wuyishanensis]MDQ0342734.1 RNA polymerase sigma-70 factor (ECF subfamily) [Lederbergia wuyishanensis]